MKFVDEAVVRVEAGKGGNGYLSFRREKYKAMVALVSVSKNISPKVVLTGTTGVVVARSLLKGTTR